MTISPPTFFLCFLENPGTLPQENWRLVFFFLYQPGPLLQMEGDNRHPIFLLNPGTQDRGLHCHGNLFFFLRDVTPKCRLCECSTCFFHSRLRGDESRIELGLVLQYPFFFIIPDSQELQWLSAPRATKTKCHHGDLPFPLTALTTFKF